MVVKLTGPSFLFISQCFGGDGSARVMMALMIMVKIKLLWWRWLP